jgi:hypothetical protein
MSIKIESFASLLVISAGVWYLATRTNLGKTLTSDVTSIPERFTGYFKSPQTIIQSQPRVSTRNRYFR